MLIISAPQILFFLTLITGMMLAVSSSSWFIMWMGLELNLMSFIPIMSFMGNRYSSESALKYFLIQAMGSATLLMAAPLCFSSPNFSYLIILTSLLLKSGAAPLHFWFPTVMQGIEWPQCLTLMTIQKVAPLSLMSSLTSLSCLTMMTMFSILSSLVGAIGGLNQTFTRKILSYSSINHLGWMIAAILFNEKMWLMYFISYLLISASVVSILHFNQIFHLNQLLSMNFHSKPTKLTLFLSLLSLGGMPPMLGFIPKMMLIQEFILTNSSLIWLATLLFSTLLTLFYYLRIAMSSFLLSSKKTTPLTKKSFPKLLLSTTLINLSPMLFPLLITIIY
uniref:NADH-ubiquinone oxidoreductase chain 2 n=1 Tax=Typhlatya galapagensis TaxID=1173210 RepID=A0A1Z2R776_9EUCA|nr:NADH dehydrogenase subunit 2 [Typhlatya galapagensis]